MSDAASINLENVKNIIRKNENPNPVLVIIIAILIVVIICYVYLMVVKYSFSGRWYRGTKEGFYVDYLDINHNPISDDISVGEVKIGRVNGNAIYLVKPDPNQLALVNKAITNDPSNGESIGIIAKKDQIFWLDSDPNGFQLWNKPA